MRNTMRPARLALLVVITAVASGAFTHAALAHIGGHAGGFSNGLAHPFYGADHVLAMVAVGLWASQLGRPALWLLPVTFPLVMAVGFALGVAGVALPWVEIGIAGSVIALGALIAFALRPSIAFSAAMIGLFALFHGHAHGTAWPAHGTALTFALGLMLATVILHGVGLAVGLLAFRPIGRIAMRTAGGAIAALGVVLLVLH
jgi:urease accessory protein